MKGIRAAFDLARAGNFPSVASNVLAALVLSWAEIPCSGFSLKELGMGIVAGCLLYAGGATFNDVFDATFDAQRRPERPIPRGVISRGAAGALAALEMLGGVTLLVFGLGASPAWTLALVVTILAYDWLHKKWVGSVVLMAGCRVLLACTLATVTGYAFRTAFVWWLAALFAYIVGLSLIARWEYKVAPASSRHPINGRQDAGATKAAKIGRSVGRLLAFIPLIDAVALLLVGAWLPALACAAAIPLGRFAQRLAAAT